MDKGEHLTATVWRARLEAGGARLRAVVRHLGVAAVTLLVISMVTFAATNVRSPESIALGALGRGAAPEQIQAFIEARDLDRPAPVRYFAWLGDMVQGDFGTSAITTRPVSDELMQRLGNTMVLVALSLLVGLPIAIALGTLMAMRAGSRTDGASLVGGIVVASTPEFIIGIVLLLVFGVLLRWLPVDSTAVSDGALVDRAKAYVLPCATLVVAVIPYVSRMTRAAVREVLESDYVRAAVLRGSAPLLIVWRHAMRNAAPAVVNSTAIAMVWLLSGTIVVENVFGFPGLGQLLVAAIGSGDTITVQATAVLLGAVFLAISIVADLIVVALNPRRTSVGQGAGT